MIHKRSLANVLGLTCIPMLVLACAAQNKQPGLKWKTALDGGCVAGSISASTPVLRGETIYVGSSDGAVYAIDSNAGNQIWRFQTGDGLPSGTDIITAPCGSSAADMLDSALRQSDENARMGKRQISATPIVDGNTVYIGSWDYNFYALDAITGSAKWVFRTGFPIMEKATMSADRVIFVTGGRGAQHSRGDGLVYALDSSSGKSAWVFDTLPDIEAKAKWPSSPPVFEGGMAYVTNWHATRYEKGSPDTATVYAHAIDVNSGEARWSSTIKAAWPSRPVVTAKYVLFMASTREIADSISLHALDISTGQEKWNYRSTGGKNYWKMGGEKVPLVAYGNIVILMTDTAVVGLDLDTGKVRWRVSEPFQDEPINKSYLGSLLYVLTGDTSKPTVGTLYGMDPESGATVWTIPMYSRNSIRAVIDDALYINTAILRNSLITVDATTGRELGTAWSLGLGVFTNESYSICSGPVRYGDRLLLTTELQEVLGEPPSRGYLYSISMPPSIRKSD